jgi:hypothetical protein
VATLGVLAWRLVNFWLPIPVGALSYVSLKVKPGQGRAAMESAVSGMLAVVGARSPYDAPQDAAEPPGPAESPEPAESPGPAEPSEPPRPAEPSEPQLGRQDPPSSALPPDEAGEGQQRRAG